MTFLAEAQWVLRILLPGTSGTFGRVADTRGRIGDGVSCAFGCVAHGACQAFGGVAESVANATGCNGSVN